MFDIDDFTELANISKKIFKSIIEASQGKSENLMSEVKNIELDDDGKKDKYEWLKGSDLEKNTEDNSKDKAKDNLNLKNEMNNRENSELRREMEYERIKSISSKKKLQEKDDLINLEFEEENIMKAMVYSEIFGEPRAKRRRR